MRDRDHFVRRIGWTSGPWDDEPDRLEWRYRDLPCLIVRSDSTGALCGYVGVARSHPWHGQKYDVIEAAAHGGLTYADACAGDICHVPQPGESDDVWWVGFDCAHAWDICPIYGALLAIPSYGTYRDIAYVRAEVEQLADQAIDASKRGQS
jgi:hypothetical protein